MRRCISPEHLSLIKRGPGERRKLFDSAICREKLKNAVVLSKYNRILNQRNSLLKDIYRRPSLADTLPVWDEPLLKSGAVLVKNRIDYVKMLWTVPLSIITEFQKAKKS